MKFRMVFALVFSLTIYSGLSLGQNGWFKPVDIKEFHAALDHAEVLNEGRAIQYRKVVQEILEDKRSYKTTDTVKLYLNSKRMWFYEKITEGKNQTIFEALLYDDRVYTRINEKDWFAGNQLSRFEDITVYSAGKNTRPNCSQIEVGQYIYGNYLATVYIQTSFSNRDLVLDQTIRTVWFSYDGLILRDETKTKQFGNDYPFSKATVIEYKYDNLDKIERPL